MNPLYERPVIEIIKENYDHIFHAERKVADFILENPEIALNSNVSELANSSGVSDATVIRLCKHIGYQGYYQLKLCLSRDLGRKQNKNEAEVISGDLVSDIFNSFSSIMISLGKNIDQDKFVSSVNYIKECNQAHLIAVGNTCPLAQYMGFRLGRLGIKCTFNNVPEYFMNHVNLGSAKDIVIAITQSGSSRQVVQAVEFAKEKGMKIITVTAHEFSPVSRLTDVLLLTDFDKGQFDFHRSYSHLRELAVIDALLHFLSIDNRIDSDIADNPEIILSEYKL